MQSSTSVHFKAVVVCFISLFSSSTSQALPPQRNSWDGTKVHSQQSETGCAGQQEQEGEIMLGQGGYGGRVGGGGGGEPQ